MISISNADRAKAVELLRAYAALGRELDACDNKERNRQRIALLRARKLERKDAGDKGQRLAEK